MLDPNAFMERAEGLIAALLRETHEKSIIADRDYVVEELRKMMSQVSQMALPPRDKRYPQLAHLVVGQWPLGHPLANEVGEVEALYRKL